MHRRIKFSLWIFPIIGIILGIAYAYMFLSGLVVTWHFVGKPSEIITRIIGFVGGHKLFVETESGNIYSFEYNYNAFYNWNDYIPTPIDWKIEEKNSLQPDPERKPGSKFVSLPLLFKVKQIYEMQFPLVEGEIFVKFALSEDGNIWMWYYGREGYDVIYNIIFPSIGLFFGSILALMIKVGILIWRKTR